MGTSVDAITSARLPPAPCRVPSYDPTIPAIPFNRIQRHFVVPLAELRADNYPYDVAVKNKGYHVPFDEYHAHAPPPSDFGHPGDVWVIIAPGALAAFARVADRWVRWAGPLEGAIPYPLLRKRLFWLGRKGGTWLSSTTQGQYCSKFRQRFKNGFYEGCGAQSAAEICIVELLEYTQQKREPEQRRDTDVAGSAATSINLDGLLSLQAGPSKRRSLTSPTLQVGGVSDDARLSQLQLFARRTASGTSGASMDVDVGEDRSLEPASDYDEDKTDVEIEIPLRPLYNAALGLGPGDSLDQEFVEIAQPVLNAVSQLYVSYQREKKARIASEEQLNRVRGLRTVSRGGLTTVGPSDVTNALPTNSTPNGTAAGARKRRRLSDVSAGFWSREMGASGSSNSRDGRTVAVLPPTQQDLYRRILYRVAGARIECRTCLKCQQDDVAVAAVLFVAGAPIAVWYGHCSDRHKPICNMLATKSMKQLEEMCALIERADDENGENDGD